MCRKLRDYLPCLRHGITFASPCHEHHLHTQPRVQPANWIGSNQSSLANPGFGINRACGWAVAGPADDNPAKPAPPAPKSHQRRQARLNRQHRLVHVDSFANAPLQPRCTRLDQPRTLSWVRLRLWPGSFQHRHISAASSDPRLTADDHLQPSAEDDAATAPNTSPRPSFTNSATPLRAA